MSKTLSALIVLLSLAVPVPVQADHIQVPYVNFQIQECPQWCWVAGSVMLLSASGIHMTQREGVYKARGNFSCEPTYGQWYPMVDVIAGMYGNMQCKARAHPFEFVNNELMVESIQWGNPFLYSQGGHIYVVYGVYYEQTANGPLVTHFEYFDPYTGQYATTSLFSILPATVQGWLEYTCWDWTIHGQE